MPVSHDEPILTLRLQLANEISRALGGSFAQHFISARYGIPQPRISELCRGKVDHCSIEWLIRRIHRMGGSVRLVVELGDPEAERKNRLMKERLREHATGLAARTPMKRRDGAAVAVPCADLIPNLE